ncbi:hypothetical protein CW663_11555, partial [Macrococcoides caseolyticum]
ARPARCPWGEGDQRRPPGVGSHLARAGHHRRDRPGSLRGDRPLLSRCGRGRGVGPAGDALIDAENQCPPRDGGLRARDRIGNGRHRGAQRLVGGSLLRAPDSLPRSPAGAAEPPRARRQRLQHGRSIRPPFTCRMAGLRAVPGAAPQPGLFLLCPEAGPLRHKGVGPSPAGAGCPGRGRWQCR